MKKIYHVLGLMSGSSLDGLDIAYCRFELENQLITAWKILKADTIEFSAQWQERLRHLPNESALVLAQSHTDFGRLMGEMVNQFIAKHGIEPDFIASHGHAIFHYPDRRFTCQIGDGASLAMTTGYPVICDFRSSDVALGGQGAPLAPMADKILFPGYDFYLNIGGIANITCAADNRYIAFDVAPANQILNALANRLGKPYDDNGDIAAHGEFDEDLFDEISSFIYFKQPYPKSLDNQFILKNILPVYLQAKGSWGDKLRTATEQLAYQIVQSIVQICKKEDITKKYFSMLPTGGGAFNGFLIFCLHEYATKAGISLEIALPDAHIIQFKEALLFALLGVQRAENQHNSLATVTGASQASIGGAIYQGWRKKI